MIDRHEVLTTSHTQRKRLMVKKTRVIVKQEFEVARCNKLKYFASLPF